MRAVIKNSASHGALIPLPVIDRQVRMKGAQTDVAEQLAKMLDRRRLGQFPIHAFCFAHYAAFDPTILSRRVFKNYETASREKVKVPIGTLGV